MDVTRQKNGLCDLKKTLKRPIDGGSIAKGHVTGDLTNNSGILYIYYP